MGQGYSAEERVQFQRYRKMMDEGITDEELSAKFKYATAQITSDIQSSVP